MPESPPLPVAVIGAGPVGLAAAAHLVARGIEPLVFEAGDGAGAAVRDWAHVRVFSPWAFNIDPVAADLLEAEGWVAPPAEAVPDRRRDRRALPRAARRAAGAARPHPLRQPRDRGHPRRDRQAQGRRPRRGAVRAHRRPRRASSSACSPARSSTRPGTWTTPEPARRRRRPGRGRARGTPIASPTASPTCSARDRDRYAGKRVMVAGTGHSAFNVLVDLVELRQDAPDTEIVWAVRREAPGDKLGGGSADQLPERGALGETVRRLARRRRHRARHRLPHPRASPSAAAGSRSATARARWSPTR